MVADRVQVPESTNEMSPELEFTVQTAVVDEE